LHLQPIDEYDQATPGSNANVFPGGARMDMLGEFAGRMFLHLKPIIDWSLNHWAITVAVLAVMILGAGKHRRTLHHHWLLRR
jgi:hypothetical protein